MKTILVTGGAGYIGTHTVVDLLENNYQAIVVDNFSNSSVKTIDRVERITGKTVQFFEADVCDEDAISDIFNKNSIDAVIHFAALKAVGESVSKPLAYYHNNLIGLMTLCTVMHKFGVKNLIFSSSATVYGDPVSVPITENFALHATNPYGQTKLMAEQILMDVAHADPDFYITCLRYFNPVGAHPSGLIGENPLGIPNNLLPFVSQVAVGKRDRLKIYGNDYSTPDGTGARDYIHVCDLARGHVAALKRIRKYTNWEAYNLGNGTSTTVMEVVAAFEAVCGKKIPYDIVDRRPGDIAICYADPGKANRQLGWKTIRTFQQACIDEWNWQLKNTEDFAS